VRIEKKLKKKKKEERKRNIREWGRKD